MEATSFFFIILLMANMNQRRPCREALTESMDERCSRWTEAMVRIRKIFYLQGTKQ